MGHSIYGHSGVLLDSLWPGDLTHGHGINAFHLEILNNYRDIRTKEKRESLTSGRRHAMKENSRKIKSVSYS